VADGAGPGPDGSAITRVCGSIVSKFGVWGLGAVLALGLSGCGGGDALPQGPLEPGGGFKAEAQEGVTATVTLPKDIWADAALIQAEATLVNHADDVVTVSVPRGCDVHDWVIRDTAGAIVMTKGSVECVVQDATKALQPGSTLSEQVYLYLMPHVLQSGTHYVVDYRFWGQPAHAEFTTVR
jgi:hypothetical protein